jgi:D-tyrosyl-tRNA(Tyr) deacylase
MNLSLAQTGGGLLLVPQFTLAADTRKGMRASFGPAADPDRGRLLFEQLVEKARGKHGEVATGVFGAHMRVRLENDGPVTFWLEARPAADQERHRGQR